jgi:hypothetical protein
MVAVVMVAIAAVIAWTQRESASSRHSTAAPAVVEGGPGRPTSPPKPGDPRPHVREPKNPELTQQWKAELTEKVRGEARPGEAAFVAYSDRFVDENLEFAQDQARAEGITLPEVRDLTRLGLLVMSTQRLPEVEEVLGRELSPEIKDALEEMVQRENGGFKAQLRALVAKRAPEAQRWELIHAADARYRAEFFRISGMTAELLDDLLAGNLLLPGAPGANPDPSSVGAGSDILPRGPRDTAVPPPRPTADPR